MSCSFLQVNFEQIDRVREAGGSGGSHAAVVPPPDALYPLASVRHVDKIRLDRRAKDSRTSMMKEDITGFSLS